MTRNDSDAILCTVFWQQWTSRRRRVPVLAAGVPAWAGGHWVRRRLLWQRDCGPEQRRVLLWLAEGLCGAQLPSWQHHWSVCEPFGAGWDHSAAVWSLHDPQGNPAPPLRLHWLDYHGTGAPCFPHPLLCLLELPQSSRRARRVQPVTHNRLFIIPSSPLYFYTHTLSRAPQPNT